MLFVRLIKYVKQLNYKTIFDLLFTREANKWLK